MVVGWLVFRWRMIERAYSTYSWISSANLSAEFQANKKLNTFIFIKMEDEKRHYHHHPHILVLLCFTHSSATEHFANRFAIWTLLLAWDAQKDVAQAKWVCELNKAIYYPCKVNQIMTMEKWHRYHERFAHGNANVCSLYAFSIAISLGHIHLKLAPIRLSSPNHTYAHCDNRN